MRRKGIHTRSTDTDDRGYLLGASRNGRTDIGGWRRRKGYSRADVTVVHTAAIDGLLGMTTWEGQKAVAVNNGDQIDVYTNISSRWQGIKLKPPTGEFYLTSSTYTITVVRGSAYPDNDHADHFDIYGKKDNYPVSRGDGVFVGTISPERYQWGGSTTWDPTANNQTAGSWKFAAVARKNRFVSDVAQLTDNGSTADWYPFTAPADYEFFASAPSTLSAFVDNRRYSLNGIDWSSDGDQPLDTMMSLDAELIGGNGATVYSSDDGSTWTQRDTGAPLSGIVDLGFDTSTNTLVGIGDGTFRSTDSGNNWSAATTAPPNISVYWFVRSDGAGTWVIVGKRLAGELAAWSSTDAGDIWSDDGAVVSGVIDAFISGIEVDNGTFMMVSYDDSGANTVAWHATSTNGSTWTTNFDKINDLGLLTHTSAEGVDCTGTGTWLVLVYESGGGNDAWFVARSTDNGANWSRLSTIISDEGIAGGNNVQVGKIQYSRAQNVWVVHGIKGGTSYYSTNGGGSWTAVSLNGAEDTLRTTDRLPR